MQYQQGAPTEILRPAPPPYPGQFDFSTAAPVSYSSPAISPALMTSSSTPTDGVGYAMSDFVFASQPQERREDEGSVDYQLSAMAAPDTPATPTSATGPSAFQWHQIQDDGSSSPGMIGVDRQQPVCKFVKEETAGTGDSAAILDLDTNRLLFNRAVPAPVPAVQPTSLLQQQLQAGVAETAYVQQQWPSPVPDNNMHMNPNAAVSEIPSAWQLPSSSVHIQQQRQPCDSTLGITSVTIPQQQVIWSPVAVAVGQQQPQQPFFQQQQHFNPGPPANAFLLNRPPMQSLMASVPEFSPSSMASGPGGTWLPETEMMPMGSHMDMEMGLAGGAPGHVSDAEKRNRPFHCDICDKYFIRKGHLNRHLSTSAHRSRLGTLATTSGGTGRSNREHVAPESPMSSSVVPGVNDPLPHLQLDQQNQQVVLNNQSQKTPSMLSDSGMSSASSNASTEEAKISPIAAYAPLPASFGDVNQTPAPLPNRVSLPQLSSGFTNMDGANVFVHQDGRHNAGGFVVAQAPAFSPATPAVTSSTTAEIFLEPQQAAHNQLQHNLHQQQQVCAETYFYVQQHEHQQQLLLQQQLMQQQQQQRFIEQQQQDIISTTEPNLSPSSPYSPSSMGSNSNSSSPLSSDYLVGSSSSSFSTPNNNSDAYLPSSAASSTSPTTTATLVTTTSGGKKRLVCPICNKKSSTDAIHEEHMSIHKGEKPYKCNQCPKQFGHKTDLRRHLCLHTGEKPFACRVCGKRFIRKDHMTKHCEVHKKEEIGQFSSSEICD